MSACCRIGALLGGLPPGQVEALTRYGLDIGVAFQISDDSLDFVADQDRLGKAIGADLREGKRTRSEEHTSELQSQSNLVCRLLLEKKKKYTTNRPTPIPLICSTNK